MKVTELQSYGVGYHRENYPFLSITTGKKKVSARCPECKQDKLRWENWGEVKVAEEQGREVDLKAVCDNCKAVTVSTEVEVGGECGREERKEDK